MRIILIILLLTSFSCKIPSSMNTDDYTQLLAVIHNYYPKNLFPGDDEYMSSPEYNRLVEICNKNIDNKKKLLLLKELQDTFHNENKIEDCSHLASTEPCFRFRIHSDTQENAYSDLVINISILTNKYIMYKILYKRVDFPRKGIEHTISFTNFSEDEKISIGKIEKKIRKIFPDYETMSELLLNKKIPDISPLSGGLPGEATVFDCLFSDHIW